ncbi:MAG: 2-succinyl-5-enolpyruvyl-6-hydroxy-3-cyclohexene-1-carboxylic-acid synthase [Verrucomicrobia bacterium]|nr:2-succinyl-5-enolpyruvyl-6-hydroxy-3-cyclohexene-1-carboxylic-acid synthase [Verrucomicrobiota bacterium]
MNLLWAEVLIEELLRLGIRLCVIGAGSRSSPLTVAAARHPSMATRVHVDERGAAFYALGHARAMGEPCAWITTSGTATANGFPAIIEASQSRVPLVLLTADRPPELRDTGANQTINQVGLYGTYVRWSADVPCPAADRDPTELLALVDDAVHHARRNPAGPVHLNCMFREPLLPEPDATPAPRPASLTAWRDSKRPYRSDGFYGSNSPAPPPVDEIVQTVSGVSRGLLVAGALHTPGERVAVAQLAGQLGWPMLPDITSGLRLGAGGDLCVAYTDQLLAANSEQPLAAAIVHVGGAITSKRLLNYLARQVGVPYVHLRPDPARLDPNHQVTLRVCADIEPVCARLGETLVPADNPAWLAAWSGSTGTIHAALDAGLAALAVISEPFVARAVSQGIPDNHQLFLGSSMPVRDMDAFGDMDGPSVDVMANRGASGIDGSIATAAGLAAGGGRPVTAVIGDLAFLHDLNSLALLTTGVPVTLVVINNDGGGIFSFLPVARHTDVFEPYFGTPHGLTFASAAQLYGLAYTQPATPAAFREAYAAAVASSTSTVIEVRTDRRENVAIHQQLTQMIRAALA